MNKIKVFYWIATVLFAAAMISTAVPNVLKNEDSIKFISTNLGYPAYLIPFIGAAKIAGSIVILIPGLKTLKEWAYAGLVFDLVGATYSVIALYGVSTDMAPMLVFYVLFAASYILWKKLPA